MNECKHKWAYAAILHMTICEICHKQKTEKENKYGAKRTTYNNREYHSAKEAKYAAKLDLKIKAGIVSYYLEQVPLRYKGGGKLILDFIVFNVDGSVEYIDVKGSITAMYLAKKRIVESTYPIKIKEV
jgi:hypothetical protein